MRGFTPLCLPSKKHQITIDIVLLKQNFPHLTCFSDRLMRDLYVLNGIAPFEITIPKEFLFSAFPRNKRDCNCTFLQVNMAVSKNTVDREVGANNPNSCLPPLNTSHSPRMCSACVVASFKQSRYLEIDHLNKFNLVTKVGRAFQEIGYTYYDRYYFYRERLGVRSLFELHEYDLRKLNRNMI